MFLDRPKLIYVCEYRDIVIYAYILLYFIYTPMYLYVPPYLDIVRQSEKLLWFCAGRISGVC